MRRFLCVLIALGACAVGTSATARPLDDDVRAGDYLKATVKERVRYVAGFVSKQLADAPKEQRRVAIAIDECIGRALSDASGPRRRKQDLKWIVSACYIHSTGHAEFANGLLSLDGSTDELMFNLADNVASSQLGVQRCGAEYTPQGKLVVESVRKLMPLQVETAARKTIDDVRSVLRLFGKERDGDAGETVALCIMIAKTYARPGDMIAFPEGSMWRK